MAPSLIVTSGNIHALALFSMCIHLKMNERYGNPQADRRRGLRRRDSGGRDSGGGWRMLVWTPRPSLTCTEGPAHPAQRLGLIRNIEGNVSFLAKYRCRKDSSFRFTVSTGAEPGAVGQALMPMSQIRALRLLPDPASPDTWLLAEASPATAQGVSSGTPWGLRAPPPGPQHPKLTPASGPRAASLCLNVFPRPAFPPHSDFSPRK